MSRNAAGSMTSTFVFSVLFIVAYYTKKNCRTHNAWKIRSAQLERGRLIVVLDSNDNFFTRTPYFHCLANTILTELTNIIYCCFIAINL